MKFSSRIKSLIAAILIIAFFVVLNLKGFLNPFKNFFYSLSSPIQKNLWRAGNEVSGFLVGILEIKTFNNEIENLQIENKKLIKQIIGLKELKKENETLRQALNMGLEKEFQIKLSYIISRGVSQDSLLIDKGLKDGIKKGMPVITKEKVIVGRIGEVYEDFSEVILITNKNSSFDAQVLEKEIYGVVKGRGNLKIGFEFIPKEKEVLPKELVVSTSLGHIFPKGLNVGKIKEVKKSDLEPFQSAEIEPAFNLEGTDSLFIITDF
jgi:rod shape-determining protein MreC